ncbi:hypothetical protein CoNPh26_CDS0049 [Staphylococcus phage S-CoN_Ph26]|nr:hypothetical protein CoNPh26_CDS0049 [Staphylococcus phage S-CoN_Ph26]
MYPCSLYFPANVSNLTHKVMIVSRSGSASIYLILLSSNIPTFNLIHDTSNLLLLSTFG